jgi:hypothetical protein
MKMTTKEMSVDHDGYAKITMRKTIKVECNNQPSQFHIYRGDLYGQWKSLICHIANFNFFHSYSVSTLISTDIAVNIQAQRVTTRLHNHVLH